VSDQGTRQHKPTPTTASVALTIFLFFLSVVSLLFFVELIVLVIREVATATTAMSHREDWKSDRTTGSRVPRF
jgi:hypothetical protein